MFRRMYRFLLFPALLLLAYALLSSPTQSVEAAGWPRTLDITWCWGMTYVDPQCPHQDVILYRDGTLFVDTGSEQDTGQWTYDRGSRTLTLTFDSYPTIYEGVRQSGRCYEGTMENPTYGTMGVWSGCY